MRRVVGWGGARVVGRWIILGMLPFTAVCMQDHPTAPAPRAFAPSAPRFAVTDARTGAAGFYWRPPFIAAAPYAGTFDPALDVSVRICVLAGRACGPDIAALSRATSPAVTIDSAAQAYTVTWHSKGVALAVGSTLRVRALVGALELGAADVRIVAGERDLKSVPDGYVGLVANRPLPIGFRIETGIVGEVRLSDTSATVVEGDDRQLTAKLIDLHGRELADVPIAWASADSGIARVVWPSGPTSTTRGLAVGRTVVSARSQRATGNATIIVEPRPATLGLGLLHTCALGRDGRVSCWGDNLDGELGRGLAADGANPLARVVGGDTSAIVEVATGASQSCALSTTGVVTCWGSSAVVGSEMQVQSTPVRVRSALAFRHVSVGASHACALAADGSAWCWGLNESGQLGDGTLGAHAEPVAVSGGLRFVSIAAGYFSTCALSADGRVYCWGHNCAGELGDGTTTPHATPMPIATSQRFTRLSMQWSHGCALTAEGEAWCWGPNWSGQLGGGFTEAVSLVPVPAAPGLRLTTISAGQGNTCALGADGVAYCWGGNEYGQLGDGTTTDRTTATAVSGAPRFIRIVTGGAHTCGVTDGGVAWCWGHNAYGQLGDGTTANRLLPARVTGATLYR